VRNSTPVGKQGLDLWEPPHQSNLSYEYHKPYLFTYCARWLCNQRVSVPLLAPRFQLLAPLPSGPLEQLQVAAIRLI
jgi:hypothetical protein